MPDRADLVIWLPTAINLAFMFALGACVGSFVHVVAWRMPQGLSIVTPPSRCPTCGFRLPWNHNLPVLGYLFLRGRCGACGIAIPRRYVLAEVAMGALFAAIYAVLYLPEGGSFWFPVGEGWWHAQGWRSVPALLVVLWAVGSLVAMTMCDWATYLIPVAIPTLASVVAFAGWPIAAALAEGRVDAFPLEPVGWRVGVAAIGMLAGLGVSRVLLAAGVLPRSFADYDQYLESPDDTFADYPHARREMLKEIAFVGPGVLLGALAWLAAGHVTEPASLHPSVAALLSVAVGFVVGGAMVWVLRIVATLLMDTEAMGLGDVHLMAAVGAAFGWKVAGVGFLVAPFVGLAWWLVLLVRSAPWRVPYGPSLAVGSIAAFFLEPGLRSVVSGALAGMGRAAEQARAEPGGTLVLAVMLAGVSAGVARAARSGRGVLAAASIALMVVAVVSWILAAGSRPVAGALVAAFLVASSIAGSVLVRPGLEDGAGPRTAVARILRMLAFTVVLAGAFLLVARPGGGPGGTPGG
ncbi:MAG: prepilin peptidase [Phycisphaerales bacterium]|jgi:leader peptidase (prepilin peptidase)/N-methyltransferase